MRCWGRPVPFRPHRLHRLWLAAGAFGRRDPTLFVAVFALWMLLSGVSLLLPGDAYDASPVFSLAKEMNLREPLVGAAMVANAVMLAYCLGDRPPGVRAWVAYMSGALWVFWALLMFFSGLRANYVSGGAIWTIAASVGLIRCAWPLEGSPHPVEREPLPRSPREWPEEPTLLQGAD